MIVADIDSLDPDVIGSYLDAAVSGFGAIRSIKKFADGQSNPTFLIETDSGQFVLRRQPPGELLKSAHAVDREFRVITALHDSDVPVPRAIHLCENRDVIGSKFFLMSYEPGIVYWDPALPELSRDQRWQVYDEMNRVLAALHEIKPGQAGLSDFGKPGNYFERQISRWSRQYRASETEKIRSMETLLEWLPQHIPDDDGQVSLIHGDYRIDNMIFEPRELKLRAVLDWELSTLGHPYSDIAYQCMQWRMGRDEAIAGLGELDRSAHGIPTEAEYVERYCERRGLEEIPNWNFYLVFNFFRMAAILQGVMSRALAGNASSAKALDYGALTPRMSDMAVSLLES